MSTLSDKLKSLGVKVGAQDLAPSRPRPSNPIEEILPGRFHSTSNGDTYIVDAYYPKDHTYGNTGLCYSAPLKTLGSWTGDEARICSASPTSFAFIDTETTGLSGGTGTYAFLIGAGRFEGDHFHLAQFFMRDPLEEPAQLLALEEFLAPCDILVSYNGKSFDVPLLNTRYRTQGWQSPLTPLAHVDLLHLSRRIWRERLSSRTLGNIETFVLGARRTEEDVPGWMIPQMYFDYLQTGDASPLKSVFYHNAMDVLALAALLNHASQLLESPVETVQENLVDLIGVGKLYEDLGRTDEAAQVYYRCLEGGLPENLVWDTLQRLSMLKKRMGDYGAAIALWKQAAEEKQIYAFEELAKYYEHQVRDYEEAARWSQAALDLILSPGFPRYLRKILKGEYEHRLERLQRKQSKE